MIEGDLPDDSLLIRGEKEDYVTAVHVPQSKPSRYEVRLMRFDKIQDSFVVAQVSEQMGREEARRLVLKWAKWHRVEWVQ